MVNDAVKKATSGETLVEARGDTDAQIVQSFASVDENGAPAPDITYVALNFAIEHVATAIGGRDKVVDGPLVLVLVVSEVSEVEPAFVNEYVSPGPAITHAV